jgi:hypothetical protein
MERNKKGWPWPGVWKVVCDVCGVQYPSDKVRQRWDGYMVCEHDWETRHPQTLYNYRSHTSVPDFVRPEPEDQFVFLCTATTSSGYTGMGTVGCAQTGNNTVPYQILLDLSGNGHNL